MINSPGAVTVIGPVEPAGDGYHASEDKYHKGGAHACVDAAARDAIPAYLITPGTQVTYPDGTSEHRNAANDGWVAAGGGGSVQTVNGVEPDEDGNVALGLAPVASSGSASDLLTGTLPSERIAASSITNAMLAPTVPSGRMKGSLIGAAAVIDLSANQARTVMGLGDSATRNVGTTAGTVAAGDDTGLVAARIAAARDGVDPIPTNSFALTFAGRRVQQRDADGAVTITGLTGLSAGAEVSLVIRNTTGADIPVSFVPSISGWTADVQPTIVPAGGEAEINATSLGVTDGEVVATWEGPRATRSMLDVWATRVCSGISAATADTEIYGVSMGAGGAGTAEDGDIASFGGWRVRTATAPANSGYAWRTGDSLHRGGLMQRCRCKVQFASTDYRTIVAAFFNAATDRGFGFNFVGLDVKARMGGVGGFAETVTPFSLTLATYYIFEAEMNAANTAATFRIYDGNTDALLWQETLSGIAPVLGAAYTRWLLQGTRISSAGAQDITHVVTHMQFGDRRGYDAWRGAR